MSKLILTLLLVVASYAAYAGEGGESTTISLSAQGTQQVDNDLATATVFFEDSHDNAKTLARAVNRTVSTALETARAVPSVEAQSANMHTYPIHARDNDDDEHRIAGWRMRADISLESRDFPALSELIGRLQQEHGMKISALSLQPAPGTRESAADKAALSAMKHFQRRADTLSQALNSAYRIVTLDVDYGHAQPPVRPFARSAMLSTEDTAAPIEGGQTDVTVRVSGSIELKEKP